jgi:uncharacterized protein (TIGR03435 family)
MQTSTMLAALISSTACSAYGQASNSPLTFEVVSLKPVSAAVRPGIIRVTGGPGSKDPGRYHHPFISLKEFVRHAYDVQEFQIVGPGWLDSEYFDIEATQSPSTTEEQFREMLQNLLSDRFKLVFHRESRGLPVYSLTVTKGGPKVKESTETQTAQGDQGGLPGGRGQSSADGFPAIPLSTFGRPGTFPLRRPDRARLIVIQQTMREFSRFLMNPLGHPVTDATGLTGKYDFTLTFSVDGTTWAYAPMGPVAQPDAELPPDIFTVLKEQLGLALVPGKGHTDVIVIDHVEKVPAGN